MSRAKGRKHTPRTCEVSGLRIINTELDAKIALARRVWADKGEIRHFPCGNHYHLTAQEQRSVEGMRVAASD